MSKFQSNQDRDPWYGRRLRRKIEQNGSDVVDTLGFGSQAKGLDAEWQDFKRIITIYDSTAPVAGSSVEFHINPGEAHYLRSMTLLMQMAGPIVGSGSTHEAYAEGIVHLIDRVEFLLNGGKVFYTILAGDILANYHELYDNRDDYDLYETLEGYGSITTRDTQLGSGYTYRVRLQSFLDSLNLFPLRTLDKFLIVRVYLRSGSNAVVDAGSYSSGSAFTSLKLECLLRNGPDPQIQAIDSQRRTEGLEFHATECQWQRKAVTSGSTDYTVPFTGINGVNNVFFWTLRAQSDITAFNYTTWNTTVTKWNILANKAPLLQQVDVGIDPSYQLGEYLLMKTGKKVTTHYVHAYFWSILNGDNHPNSHIVGGHYTFMPGNDYDLTFTLSGSLAADSYVDIYGLNNMTIRISPAGDIESYYV